MHILLFGGSFDPPHTAHTTMVETLLEQGVADQVWYVPVAVHQKIFAKNGMSGIEDRLAMLKLIQQPQTKIEKLEIATGYSRTHTTLRKLSAQHPQHRFSFVMGSDQLAKLHLWNCDQEKQCFPQAADEFEYYVYPRQGFPLDLPYPNLKVVQDVQPMAISSTEIRAKVQAGESITGLVAPAVEQYIEQHQLYLESGGAR